MLLYYFKSESVVQTATRFLCVEIHSNRTIITINKMSEMTYHYDDIVKTSYDEVEIFMDFINDAYRQKSKDEF